MQHATYIARLYGSLGQFLYSLLDLALCCRPLAWVLYGTEETFGLNYIESRYVQLICAVCEMATMAMRTMSSFSGIFIYVKTSDMRLEFKA